MALISVILPTIKGREKIFAAVRDSFAYADYGADKIEVIVEHGHPAVGCAWQAGAERAQGDFLLLANDDCAPREGWHLAAIEAVERGFIPSPLVFNPKGEAESLPVWGLIAPDWTQVSCCLIPFVSREQWEAVQPLPRIHYFSDNFLTVRAKWAGWGCVLRHGFRFTHYWAQEGRGAGMASQADREDHDERLYYQALAKVTLGEWKEPWPPEGKAP